MSIIADDKCNLKTHLYFLIYIEEVEWRQLSKIYHYFHKTIEMYHIKNVFTVIV